jgi:hypothetical protein
MMPTTPASPRLDASPRPRSTAPLLAALLALAPLAATAAPAAAPATVRVVAGGGGV